MGRQLAESNVKLGGFRSQLEASNVSCHTEELSYNETVDDYIYIYMLGIWEMYIMHKTFIMFIECSYVYESKKHAKHWRLSWFKYETVITFFKFRFSTRGERDTLFLCWLFVHRQFSTHWLNQRACAPPQSTNWTGLAQVRKINSLRLSSNHNSLLLFKINKNPCQSLPGMTSFTSLVPFPNLGFYWDICDCHILPACAWTLALVSAPTRAQSRKVLSLTKPKDKIYKSKNDHIKKSFRNYTTHTHTHTHTHIYIYIYIYIYMYSDNSGYDRR